MNVPLGYQGEFNCSISECGAMMHRCNLGENKVIYPFHEREDGKKRGGVPICFPFFGPAPPIFSGVSQHGWLRDQKFHLISQQSSIAQSVFFIGDNAGTLEQCTFPYISYGVLHLLKKESRSIETHLSFFGSRACRTPLNPGFHPYFPYDGASMVKIGNRIYTNFLAEAQCVYVNPEDDIIISTGKLTIAMILKGFTRRTCVYLWSDAPHAYFCVEPVLYPVEYFNTDRGFFLQGTESGEMSMILRCL